MKVLLLQAEHHAALLVADYNRSYRMGKGIAKNLPAWYHNALQLSNDRLAYGFC